MSRPPTRWPDNGIFIRSIHQREQKPSVQLFLWPFGPSISLKSNNWCLVFINTILSRLHHQSSINQATESYFNLPMAKPLEKTVKNIIKRPSPKEKRWFIILRPARLCKEGAHTVSRAFITATSGTLLSGFAPSAVGTSCIGNYNHRQPKLTLRAECNPGAGHLGIFWVGMCRPGLQMGTPF